MIKVALKITVILILSLGVLIGGLDILYRTKPLPEIVYSKPNNTISIHGLIGNASPLLKLLGIPVVDMTKVTQELLTLIRSGEKHVYVSINSPGGLLTAGNTFIFLMNDAQRMGVEFTCIVNGRADSMATIIFSECNNRLATVGSTIMWHSVAQQGNQKINEYSALALHKELKLLNQRYWKHTRMHFYPWYFNTHFINETKLSVTELERKGFMYLRVIREHIIQ